MDCSPTVLAGIPTEITFNSTCTDLIYALNVAVPVKICNQLKQTGYKGVFISFGSYFELGENSDDHFFTETELLQSQRRTRSDYSISKRMFSRFISSVEMPYKTWHFILPTIYGERESAHRLIPYTICIKNKYSAWIYLRGTGPAIHLCRRSG